ncbi:hypothetical protein KPH14_002538 [Odynerus spinipes]|uniref:Regulatory protein zeste n=1 Tax=Odynerus spinipes TaxID=1348599 RepID=A0AAD9VSZ3_9HYME|nr:hypothetical protein KPH14_002538 [Odynerus spinipes]
MSSGSTATTTVLLKKRERTQNWVPEEKNVLFSLIKSHANAIENKKIDAAASAMKTLAWQQIYRSFRARFSTERDITRMREQWRRMKAQARIEMYTFAEKVRTLGPEEATKSRPSNLSIEVWRLMEKARKHEGEGDRSDESSQDFQDNSTSLRAILDKLTSTALEASVHDIKLEKNHDSYNTDDEESQNESLQKRNDSVKKKRSRSRSIEPIDLVERKLSKMSDSFQRSDNNVEESNDLHDDEVNVYSRIPDEENELNTSRSFRNTNFIFEATRKEHDLKVKMLNIELERAELQKQGAINELKTSEIKRRMMEDQATEYYSYKND